MHTVLFQVLVPSEEEECSLLGTLWLGALTRHCPTVQCQSQIATAGGNSAGKLSERNSKRSLLPAPRTLNISYGRANYNAKLENITANKPIVLI